MKNISLGRFSVLLCGSIAALAMFNGCSDSKHNDNHGHSHADGHGHGHAEHAPPHGGTPVVVAEDKFHLELVLDAAAGKMQAYVLDGHLEGYVQVPETNFVLAAKLSSGTEQLSFQRSGLPEKSSLFESQAEWLKTAKEFEGSIPTITLNGATFTNISFAFPKGSKHVH